MIYWTSMLMVGSKRRNISSWLSFNSLAGFFGFLVATLFSTLADSRILFALLFFLPFSLMRLTVKNGAIKRNGNNRKINKKLVLLGFAGFFMVFHASMWSNFLPIYLNDILPSLGSYISTGIFLACDSLFFTFVFYMSGKVETRAKGAAMVALTTFLFTAIVFAIPLLPLAPFLLAFIVLRNIVIAFRMVGVAELVSGNGLSNFQTQFYSTFANSAAILAPVLGGIISDSIGLESVFYFSAPVGFLSSLLFIL
jgi:MFS family permease